MSDVVIVKRPVVAGTPRPAPVAAVATTLGLVGLGVFFWLSSARAAQEGRDSILPPLSTAVSSSTLSPAPTAISDPPQLPGAPAASFATPDNGPVTLMPSASGSPSSLGAPMPTMAPMTPFAPMTPVTTMAPVDPMRDRLRAPALIVDFTTVGPAR